MKNKKSNKLIFTILGLIVAILIIIIVFLIIKLNKNSETTNNVFTNENKSQNPIATIDVSNYGTIKVELYPNIAPNTVKNFIALANNGYYDGLTFNRVVKNFMIQGGAYYADITAYKFNEDGIQNENQKEEYMPFLSDINSNISWNDSQDKQYSIKGEFSQNGYNNSLSHTEGVISMARYDYSALGKTEEGYNSAGSQFFIVTKDSQSLDGLYASFGKVVDGMDVVHNIENIETNDEIPNEPPVITSIKVDTYGKDYGLPDTIDFVSASDILGTTDNTKKEVNIRLKKKQEDTNKKQKETKKKEFINEIKEQLISISKQYSYNYTSSEVWKTLSNGDYVVLLSMNDPRYTLAKYCQLIEFDPNSKKIIEFSELFGNDERMSIISEFVKVWGYNEAKDLFNN